MSTTATDQVPDTGTYPSEPHSPATLLYTWLKATGSSAATAARAIGISRQHMHKLLNEELRVTPEMAFRLARWTSTRESIWLQSQSTRDIQRLRDDPAFQASLSGVLPWQEAEKAQVERLRAEMELVEGVEPVRRRRTKRG